MTQSLYPITVSFDTSQVQAQAEEMLSLFERLPESVRDGFRSRLTDLSDFGIETETVPAAQTGSFVVRFRSVALAEFCAAALRALDGDGA